MVNRSDVSKEKHRQAQREKLKDPEYRAKHNATIRERYREKMRCLREGLPLPPDRRYKNNQPAQKAVPKSDAERLRKSKWGLTSEQYEALLASQNHKCPICGCSLLDIDPKYRHIDHNHTTGEIRGVLCHSCNMGIGCLKDSQELLQHAINYLTSASTGLVKPRK